jgi:hypothetical protein
VITLPGKHVVRWRWWVIAAWAALAALFAPKATHVQRVLAVRGGAVERSESARASQAFLPFRSRHRRAGPCAIPIPAVTVLDSISAELARQPYMAGRFGAHDRRIDIREHRPPHYVPHRC